MRQLIVYGRNGCHLCELAVEELELVCRASGVTLRWADVDADPRRASLGPRVPVVFGDEEELSGWPLDRQRILSWVQNG